MDQELLASLPVDGPFEADDVRRLEECDLQLLADVMRRAPVDGPFSPGQAVALAGCRDLQAALAAGEAASAEAQGPIDPSALVEIAVADGS